MAAPKLSHGGVEHRKPPKELRNLTIKHAENAGHIVTHEFTSYEHEPEHHVFAEDEGQKLLAHVAKHMGIKHEEPDGDEGEYEDEKD